MNNELQQQIITSALDEIGGLLREHIVTIDKSMQSESAEHTSETAPFKYTIRIGLVIQPFGSDQAKIVAKLGYSVRHTDESIGQIVDPNQMKMGLTEDEG